MREINDEKITAGHLRRNAFLYVRQSSMKQVRENTESADRQYALRKRAISLGWHGDQIVVIDEDQATSAASASNREGFQKLVAEVGMGHAGLVMGLEVSRLARNNSEWHKLLEICALTETLILDEDGLYDAGHFNDRLLLGLKGAMSEAELHVLRARLRGGALNKASRGELSLRLPTGYLHDDDGKVVIDPDRQVQSAIKLLFNTFSRVGSEHATVKYFREQNLKFPTRIHRGPDKGKLSWGQLTIGRINSILHNPCYAGVYAYGRSHIRKLANGKGHFRWLPKDEWHALVFDAHEGYISWDEFKRIQLKLTANVSRQGQRPPREGSALLQGIAICGICGARMQVSYRKRRGGIYPDYSCLGLGNKTALPPCQFIPADHIEQAINNLLLEVVSPITLEVTLAVQEELESRQKEVDDMRRREVEKARYESDQARHRYLQVDAENRLVAETLELEWNEKLKALTAAEEEYERQKQQNRELTDRQNREKVMALAQEFPRIWNNPKTSHRERKRLVRLLIEDVTLLKEEKDVKVHVRFKGGATHSLVLPRLLSAFQERKTSSEVVKEIDRLLDDHTSGEVAEILNNKGMKTGTGLSFQAKRVERICTMYNLPSRFDRFRKKGGLITKELAKKMNCSDSHIWKMRENGELPYQCVKVNGRSKYIYLPLDNGEKNK